MQFLEFTPLFVYTFLIVLCRVGTIIMFLPGIGEAQIPSQSKLLLSLLFCLLITPMINIPISQIPVSAIAFFEIIALEILVGSVIGTALRTMLSCLHLMGIVTAFQSGLSAGVAFDPINSSQGTYFGNFMTLFGIAAIFSIDLDHHMLKGILMSYEKFPLGVFQSKHNDFYEMIIRVTQHSFTTGIQLATPFIAAGLLFYTSSSILARLMPQIQIFTLAVPGQILLVLTLFMLTLGKILVYFVEQFDELIITIFK